MSNNDFASLQHIQLIAGHIGTPGAPVLQLALTYNTENGVLNGEALITQAVAPPYGRLEVLHATGQVHVLGFGPAKQTFTVEGEIFIPFPPPQIGHSTEKFSASFITDLDWKGSGSFSYGNNKVVNVPVEPKE